jgi:hypothetical protein
MADSKEDWVKSWLPGSAVVLLSLVSAAWCDDGAVTGVGGRIRLMEEHPGIALIAEHVHAYVSPVDWTAEVECIFVLSNGGAADSVLIGFPESSGGDTGPRPFSSFQSYVDGREVRCVRRENSEPLADYLFWWTKEVYFAAGQTRVIRDVYRSPLGVAAGDATGYERFFEYELWTGSSWSGDIGAATVVLTLSPCDSVPEAQYVSPSPLEVGTCEYRWHLSDLEPGRRAPGTISVSWVVPYEDANRRREH